jgi:hypothetical protein
MKVLVVDRELDRRAELVDAICELEHVEVCGTAGTAVEAREVLAAEPIDMVIEGAMSSDESSKIAALSLTYHCELVRATSASEVSEIVRRSAREYADWAERPVRSTPPASIASPEIGPLALSYAFLAGPGHSDATSTQTIDLSEWLPATVEKVRTMLPAIVEVVIHIADGTLPVRCVPTTLEHSVFQLLLQASASLVWGGTIWLMADTRLDGLVRLTVLENAVGELRDLTLSTSHHAFS